MVVVVVERWVSQSARRRVSLRREARAAAAASVGVGRAERSWGVLYACIYVGGLMLVCVCVYVH